MDVDARLSALEELCNQMNTNISSLQTIINALQDNDYVKSVTPVMQDGKEIGYTITFSKSNPITIYHGKDGSDGADGADGADGEDGSDGNDGSTPVIGVRQDTDGIYYWTLNGEWLTDSQGNKIKAQGIDGSDGSDGVDGDNGKDGITPKFKIENGYWYVSYDNEDSWQQLGKATGENGSDGGDGDSLFSNVDYTSSVDYVIFTLSNGTQIKIPTWTAFETLQTLCNQMNTNISSLQTIINALQDNDYVKSVTPVMQDGKEIGYTITFSKSNPITIYHGKDGSDGADGADGADGEDGSDGNDGSTPVIGVRQDTDGIYYWTLNGEWLTDSQGNKIKAQGIDGSDGSDGVDGDNGKDGITPKFKIENGYWYVSYDNEDSWQQLGKATGENGSDGGDGDSLFSNVDYTSSVDYVIFTLSNGTQIKIPTWTAFEALQTLCNQMNTNISSLQTIINALQDNDYVKSVTPVMQDGKEIGYTITFSKSNPITIYHGKDGSDGADGEDGSDGNDGTTPVIGVRQDTDGIYYWTLNGEWLTDSQGNKIKAQGTDGSDGSDGVDGDNGKDGITPKFKIENGYWYVSYDNEGSWQQLGKATGENGSDGSDGDSLFESVTHDDDNVYFKLSNGTLITIPKYKELTIVFSQQVDIPIQLGKTVTITYGINGGGTNPIIETMVSDGWSAEVVAESATTGSITITCPQTEPQTKKVVVFVSDGKGRTTMATLTFVCSIYIAHNTLIYTSTNKNIVTLHDVSQFGVSVLSNVYNDDHGVITFSGDLTKIGAHAFQQCTTLSTIQIPESVITIDKAAFSACSNLIEVILPSALDKIDDYAFNFCTALKTIKIPANVSYIGESAFCQCPIEDVNIPNNITTIKSCVFSNCSSLQSVVIPNGVVEIENLAFNGCKMLKKITIPSNVKSIEDYAFRDCEKLQEIYCEPQTPPILGNEPFTGIATNAIIFVPASVVGEYSSDAAWKSLNIVGYEN